jgi:hypothetical protein
MRAVGGPARPVSRSNYRRAWGLCGLVVAVALAVPGTRLIALTGVPWHQPPPLDTTVRTVTVPQAVTSLTVVSSSGSVRVTAGAVSRVRVTETIRYGKSAGGPPAVLQSVTDGRLALANPACDRSDCLVNFAVTVPPDIDVDVSTQGDPILVSGTARTELRSGGGPVRATQIAGALTVLTGGGPLALDGVAGTLHAYTDGGAMAARGITATEAVLVSGGGPAQVTFSAAPTAVRVETGGGPATLRVPGGPYALTANSEGGPELIGIATDPAARPSISITSNGGPLQIEPASATP